MNAVEEFMSGLSAVKNCFKSACKDEVSTSISRICINVWDGHVTRTKLAFCSSNAATPRVLFVPAEAGVVGMLYKACRQAGVIVELQLEGTVASEEGGVDSVSGAGTGLNAVAGTWRTEPPNLPIKHKCEYIASPSHQESKTQGRQTHEVVGCTALMCCCRSEGREYSVVSTCVFPVATSVNTEYCVLSIAFAVETGIWNASQSPAGVAEVAVMLKVESQSVTACVDSDEGFAKASTLMSVTKPFSDR